MDLTPYFGGIVSAGVFVVGSYTAMKNSYDKRFAAIESKQASQDEKIARALEESKALRDLTTQIAMLSTKMDDLREDVNRHNSMIERTYKVEQDVKAAFHQIDELRSEFKIGGSR